jgi:hypothetical protein
VWFGGFYSRRFGILSEAEARNAVNWDIYITIAAALESAKRSSIRCC